MPQPNQFPTLLPNSSLPTFDSLYPLGDRGGSASSFTITGSGFGTKTTGVPLYDDWESASVGLVGSTIGQLNVSTTGATSVTGATSHSGTKCLTHDFISVDFPKLYREFATRSRYARMSCWWRWTGSVTSSSVWKLLRFNTDSTDPYSGMNRFSSEYTGGAGADRPSAFSGITYIDGAIDEYAGTNEVADRMDLFTPDTWHFMEWEIDAGTLNGNNATIRQKLDGVENIRYTNTSFLTTANPNEIKFILSVINGLDGATSRNVQYYVDELYSDGSLCHVVMTNNATYASSTLWAEQPVLTWSDTSIECTYNRGSFTIGATAYRHVFNSAGVLVHTSPPFTVSEAGDGVMLLSRLDLSGGLPNGSGSDSWGFGAISGASITVANDGTHDYLRGQYPIDSSGDQSGDNYIYGGYTPPSDQQDIYLQFYARMPGVKHGLKFVKFFGRNATGGSNTVANATFGLDYTGIDNGSFQYIGYGDGTGQTNDTQNGVALYTPNYIGVGRTGPLTRTITPDPKIGTFASSDWGTGWHKFQMRLRQNSGTTSGNEVNDGVVELIIDDVLYAKGENIFNRHYTNGFIETIGLFGYSRGQSSAFELHIRDGMTISTGGYVD